MDADRFDDLLRFLSASPTRRGVARVLTGLTVSGVLGPWRGLSAAEAKKKRKKKKKKKKAVAVLPPASPPPCTPHCNSGACGGGDGCGGVCGCSGGMTCQGGTCSCPSGHDECATICCGECQDCNATSVTCVMTPGSDGATCSDGTCCGGACCPPASCQCGLSGPFAFLGPLIAAYLGLPYPICLAQGSGLLCNPADPACPPNTECIPISGVPGVQGACGGLCPEAN